MPHHCCVPACNKAGHRIVDGRAVSFHRFPDPVKKKQLRNKWIHAIRREVGKHFQITQHTKVCSLHFKDTDFIQKPFRTQCDLIPEAVPSIFAWSTPSLNGKKRPPPRRRINLSATAECNAENYEELKEEEETIEDQLRKTNSVLEEKIGELNRELSEARKHLENFAKTQEELILAKTQAENSLNFNINTFKDDDASMEFYTGFNYPTFCVIYDLLDPGPNDENIDLYTRNKCDNVSSQEHEDHTYCDLPSDNKKGPVPALSFREQFFLTLVRLRTGFSEQHLSHLFHISTSTVSRYIISWINFMFLKLGSLNIWMDRTTVDNTMPKSFQQKFPTTRVIIDCTEIKTETPSTLVLNSEFFSQYKNACTVKGLVGIAPSGAVTFVSKLYSGSISDRKITEESGLLDMEFNDNDVVMADKGFGFCYR